MLVWEEVNAGQPDASHLGEVGVVDADEGYFGWDGVAEFGRGRHDAEGNQVASREDCRGTLSSGPIEETESSLVAAFFTGVA